MKKQIYGSAKLRKMAEARANKGNWYDGLEAFICICAFVGIFAIMLTIAMVVEFKKPHEDVTAEITKVICEETTVRHKNTSGAYKYNYVSDAIKVTVTLKSVDTGAIETYDVTYEGEDKELKANRFTVGTVIEYNQYSGLKYFKVVEGE